ncbi:FAD/FMN-containing dehydrogenase [Nocardioides sp. BE266]|uniref:FAD-binding oxidoreductase n=1 Tax=Nocardioides sp. BE266 TaxID=2817725 RepID=UPI00285E7E55|nr:FAD-dependent oxidoreductase [Nocardioides sp. BE266]MDR7252287.1 FAD/FMN-containing dehydrogenase [Nocardioides sp. BE266]
MPDSTPLPTADALRGLAGGAVHLPGDPLYDEARMPWNLQVDEHPAAVAYPADPQEVARVVRAAAASGLRVAPQGTGHGAPPLAGRLSDAVLLRTSAMTGLVVDGAGRTARAEAGVLWGDVVARAGRVGLAGMHMSSPGVGVIGSSLGGGVSWYSRQHGLQCSAITAVELVLADGTFVRATDDQDADLLWAARGGTGGFGVVTALEFDLLPVRTAYAGMLAWDWQHAGRVLTAWADWTTGAPEAVTSVARIFQVPDDPDLPTDIRGRGMVMIDAVALGDAEAGARAIAALRALGPEIDTFALVPAADLAHLQLDPQEPTAVYANSVLVDGFPADAVEALVAVAGPGSGSQLLFVELRQLGGALRRPAPRGGALDHLPAEFLVLGVGLDVGTGWSAVRADAMRILDSLAPWSSRASYLSMAYEAAARRGFAAAAYDRLLRIRQSVDPDGVFVTPRATPND